MERFVVNIITTISSHRNLEHQLQEIEAARVDMSEQILSSGIALQLCSLKGRYVLLSVADAVAVLRY